MLHLTEEVERRRHRGAVTHARAAPAFFDPPARRSYNRAMNRLRLWGYVVLVLLAGIGNLYFVSGWIGARSLTQVDRDLRAAAQQLDLRVHLSAAELGTLADVAARSPAVVAGLAEAQVDPLAAGEDAVRAAAEPMKLDGRRMLVGVASPRGTQAHAAGQPVTLPDPAPFVGEALRGARREAFVRLGDQVWLVTAVPAGRAGAVFVGLPADAAFVAALRASSSVDVTLVTDRAKAAALPPRRIVDVGELGRVQGFLSLPAMPLLFTHAPQARSYAVPLEGASAAVLLSVPTAPHLALLATYEAAALLVLLVLAVIGVVLGVLVSDEGAPSLPRELVHAAGRIGRGDFSVRAPTLAGSAGVLAAALNRAAEAAQAAARPSAPREEEPEYAAAAAPAMEPEAPTAAEVPAASTPPAEAPAPAAVSGATLEPVPAEPAAAAAPSEPEPLPPVPEPEPGVIPELPPPPPAPAGDGAADAAAAPVEDEESHWRTVFDDFLRVRSGTGEPAAPLSYDRFRTKLQKNRDQLVGKYGCRTVRFQVYVKEGKAAVRATPVR
jgi:hypothetical protein